LAAKVCILASSSSGNSTYISSGKTRILVDCGLSRRETFARLAAIGEDPQALDAIVISHEHSDHVCGLPVLAKSLKIPVYLTHLAAPRIDWNGYEPKLETFQAGSVFLIGDIEVTSFTIPHDAADPVAFTFDVCGRRVGIATDLGYVPESIKWHLRATDLLLLESNHDIEMLKVGPYPWSVKQRVMGRMGHLSNEVACQFIREDMSGQTQTLVLGHLSEQNNYPELVRLTAAQALASRGLPAELVVADPRRATAAFEL
jgi:phosphoribosyl 1,2-cyclic phosphodiesterase